MYALVYKLLTFFNRKQKDEFLFELGEEIKKINDKYPDINYGGCGLFAVLLYNKLKNLGYNPVICSFVYNEQAFRKSIEIYNKEGILSYELKRREGFCHVILKVGDFYMDSTGVYEIVTEMDEFCMGYRVVEGVSYKMILECSNKRSLWNNTFNRNHISEIEGELNLILERVINNNTLPTFNVKNLYQNA